MVKEQTIAEAIKQIQDDLRFISQNIGKAKWTIWDGYKVKYLNKKQMGKWLRRNTIKRLRKEGKL